MDKREAKQRLFEMTQELKTEAGRAKNVQTKDFLNILAKDLPKMVEIADARTR